MKTTVALIIATLFILNIEGSKTCGQSVSSNEVVKFLDNNTTAITSGTNVSGEISKNSRKAIIQLSVDGKSIKSGDILSVKRGQKLLLTAEMVGGRRDYCNFPDNDADIAGIAEILSRGENGISYQINGVKAEWKLLKEEPTVEVDKYLQTKILSEKPTVEITVSNEKFSQTFLKISIKTTWQFSQNGITTQEVNTAEETLYFKLEGESDVWFLTQNVQATGMENELVKENLKNIQSACDSIQSNFYRLNFAALQQSNRRLQSVVSSLKSTIDEVKSSNPSFQTKIIFIGLPSDNSYNDISMFTEIKYSWDSLEMLLNEQKQQISKLSAQATNESKAELVKIINGYANWQKNLPENTFKILARYIPGLTAEKIELPENIKSIATEKMINNYSQAFIDFAVFLDQRIQELPSEIQKINSTQSRIQAVKLFDGMLRSYVSSIYWAEWKNTRESELLTFTSKDNL